MVKRIPRGKNRGRFAFDHFLDSELFVHFFGKGSRGNQTVKRVAVMERQPFKDGKVDSSIGTMIMLLSRAMRVNPFTYSP
jgi:hypothetical protein